MTSLQELMAVTRVGAGSFYNTLKSKKRLFFKCLRRMALVAYDRPRLERETELFLDRLGLWLPLPAGWTAAEPTLKLTLQSEPGSPTSAVGWSRRRVAQDDRRGRRAER